jgi:hypothetical protein
MNYATNTTNTANTSNTTNTTNTSNNDIANYLNASKNSCICISISIVIIILFFLTPLSNFLLVSIIGKIITIIILSYAFITNTVSTYNVSKKLDVSLFSDPNYTTSESTNIKTNIVCSYIFSIFIFILILMITKKLVM